MSLSTAVLCCSQSAAQSRSTVTHAGFGSCSYQVMDIPSLWIFHQNILASPSSLSSLSSPSPLQNTVRRVPSVLSLHRFDVDDIDAMSTTTDARRILLLIAMPCVYEKSLSDQPAATGLWTAFVVKPGIFDDGRLKPSYHCHPFNMLSLKCVVTYKCFLMQTLTKDSYKIQCLPPQFLAARHRRSIEIDSLV